MLVYQRAGDLPPFFDFRFIGNFGAPSHGMESANFETAPKYGYRGYPEMGGLALDVEENQLMIRNQDFLMIDGWWWLIFWAKSMAQDGCRYCFFLAFFFRSRDLQMKWSFLAASHPILQNPILTHWPMPDIPAIGFCLMQFLTIWLWTTWYWGVKRRTWVYEMADKQLQNERLFIIHHWLRMYHH